MTLRLSDLNDDDRYDAWVRIIRRIVKEHHQHAWGDFMFRLVRAVFTTNQQLSEDGGFIMRWAVDNYVDATLMLLRRELDRQDRTENLRNLLFDIIEHPTALCRLRYLLRTAVAHHYQLAHANQVFEGYGIVRIPGKPDFDYIDPGPIRADLDRVAADVEHLREYAERTRAHRTPTAGIDAAALTFGALHEALDSVRDVIAKYNALLTQGMIAQWEPVAQFNTIYPFTRRWVSDPEAVKRAIDEERPRR